jgi:hypothetical protein
MRTHEMTSSSRRMAGAVSIEEMGGRRSIARRVLLRPIKDRPARRGLLALAGTLALIVGCAPALAQASTGASGTETSGYNQKPPTPTTKTEPKKEVEHSKEATKTTPTTSVEPATTTTTAVAPKASTLPFTGLNLTWVVGAGVLLLAAGLSIRLAQRTRARR